MREEEEETQLAEIVRAMQPLFDMEAILRADVARGRVALSEAPVDYHRRQFVRAVFAQIEGTVFAIKQRAMPSTPGAMTAAEAAMLRGESYRLDDKGKPVTGWAAISLRSDIRFAFRMYARSVGLEYELPVSEGGWASLMTAKDVRDRLMHPDSLEALSVSDSEIEATVTGSEWFDATYRRLSDLMIEQVARNEGLSESQIAEFRVYREEKLAVRRRRASSAV
jgi:hypothetical protein